MKTWMLTNKFILEILACLWDFLAEIFRRRNKSKFLAEIFRAEINCDESFGAEMFRS